MSKKENLIAFLLILILLTAVIEKKISESNINSSSNLSKTIETNDYLDSSKFVNPKEELNKIRDPKQEWLSKYEKNLKFNSLVNNYSKRQF